MFRALLWKEWRELWSLLIAAAALSAITLFFIQSNRRLLNPNVWEMAFSLWLFVAAILIPILLYVREKDTGAAHFLSARPLDRFRLWWFRLAICLTLLIAAAFVFYGTITVLSLFHAKAKTYELRKDEIVWFSIGPAIFLMSVSIFISSFFRKQLPALATIIILMFGLWVIWTIASYTYEALEIIREFFNENAGRRSILFLIASPPLCFAALLVWAGNDLPRRTKKLATLSYIPIAVAACFASGAATVSLTGDLRPLFTPQELRIRIKDVSPDGNYVLAYVLSGKKGESRCTQFISVAIKEKQAKIIEKDYTISGSAGDAVVYFRRGKFFFSKSALVLSNFQGGDQKVLYETRAALSSLFGIPSKTGNYAGAVIHDDDFLLEKSFIALFDSEGKLAGEYELPALEADAFLYPWGWDFEGRFYFTKGIAKRRRSRLWTHWRISPDNMTPERVQFLPEDGDSYISISADGKWITFQKRKSFSDDRRRQDYEELWLYNIDTDSSVLLTERLDSSAWAPTGSRLAWAESAKKDDDDNEAHKLLRLMLYDAATGTETAVSLKDTPGLSGLMSWSISGQRLLLVANRKNGDYAVLSVSDHKINPVHLQIYDGNPPHWICRDRLLWSAKDRLMMCDADGSNQREFVRLKDGDFLFTTKGIKND